MLRRDNDIPRKKVKTIPHINTPVGTASGKVVTNNYVFTSGDRVIICNKATAMTITLPLAVGAFVPLYVANVGAGTVTVSVTSASPAHTIDAETSQTVEQWETLQVIDYATGKYKIL